MRGGANVTIPLKEIGNVEISVPNIKKQREFIEIINKIEQLKSKSDKRNALNSKLFKLVLNYAYQGKL